MVTKTRKERLDDELARREAVIFKAIGHPIRVRILHHLADGPANVQGIADAVGAERSNISRHLAVLRAAGILDDAKVGLNVNYTVAVPCILDAFLCCNRVIRRRLKADARILDRLR